jgi:hypothetical protein
MIERIIYRQIPLDLNDAACIYIFEFSLYLFSFPFLGKDGYLLVRCCRFKSFQHREPLQSYPILETESQLPQR